MKTLLPLFLMLVPLSGDTLKLRNGTVMQGHFVAGDERSIWFQTGIAAADSYPLAFVESLSFGPAMPVPSSYSPASTWVQPKPKKMLNLREALWPIRAARRRQTGVSLR